MDLRHKFVILDSQAVSLDSPGISPLVLLLQHIGEVVPRAILLTEIFGYASQARTRTLDTHISRLRKKLGREGRCIETIFGTGYRFRLLHGSGNQGLSDLTNST